MRTYGYVRVSTKGQNKERQLKELEKYVDERYIFQDEESGKNFERAQYQLMRKVVQKGDTIYIHSLDRFGRNKEQIKEELKYFKDEGVMIKVLNIPTTLIEFPEGQEWIMDMINNLLIEVLSTIAEQERLTTRKRQAEGMAVMPIGEDGKRISLKTGNSIGRPPVEYPLNWELIYNNWKNKKITAVKAMEELNLKKNSFYNLVKRYGEGD